MATFFNREAAANTAFNAIVSAYNANKQLAATYLSKNSGEPRAWEREAGRGRAGAA